MSKQAVPLFVLIVSLLVIVGYLYIQLVEGSPCNLRFLVQRDSLPVEYNCSISITFSFVNCGIDNNWTHIFGKATER